MAHPERDGSAPSYDELLDESRRMDRAIECLFVEVFENTNQTLKAGDEIQDGRLISEVIQFVTAAVNRKTTAWHIAGLVNCVIK